MITHSRYTEGAKAVLLNSRVARVELDKGGEIDWEFPLSHKRVKSNLIHSMPVARGLRCGSPVPAQGNFFGVRKNSALRWQWS